MEAASVASKSVLPPRATAAPREASTRSRRCLVASQRLAVTAVKKLTRDLPGRSHLSSRTRTSPSSRPTSPVPRSYPVTVCVADVATVEEVEFTWQGECQEVLVTGDFLNWEDKVALTKSGTNTYSVKQKLPPGRYSFKFIVDGVWQHSQFHPTIPDGAGGFNNTLVIEEPKNESKDQAKASSEPPKATPSAPETKPEAAPAAKAAAPAGKAAGKKAAPKAIGQAMNEDIIPKLKEILGKEEGLESVAITFDSNELRGSFIKNGIPYDFWAYFPDGDLNGVRGFSLTSCGNTPSTVEPFIIDERKITPELVVFWVTKRLFAQKLLSLN